MKQEMVDRIKNDPDFLQLTRVRSKFAWTLTIVMLVIYFGFVLVIAFDPSILGTPLSEGSVTTVGIPVGVAVIISAFILTGIYVRRANTEFDELTARIKAKAKGE
ncbi:MULTISPECIES: DUF485 domain-containing protein [unclassified Sulfuricurvum]|uniref:DUF485 domain-containing protein n=1 Tax=unclassified Sulfuricurvum TaxID=2632390 RepID=UPI0002997BB9|nr:MULTISPECIES: DUF485 domain-containing protein [unclassified Sulfuricurvum]AFV97028.1 hypothetical protein B649_03570 [Candidatus Sulfuricurvum sp. RIFRC-1]OHD87710.1 MAG: hypothetical protein A2Y52_00320 [Sulfuricurvum sp. RIFCSPLOWO2_02_43_6]OHD88497.1 MAG: hypothetical protein A3G19_06090 [Sulfuricurvum sp. RIFCSPLOWO2_12_FULL_43_24]HBM35297.1 DUF485 domain-containing protein [Sulfuricurvum sp.]